jgi:hypothetical protein
MKRHRSSPNPPAKVFCALFFKKALLSFFTQPRLIVSPTRTNFAGLATKKEQKNDS